MVEQGMSDRTGISKKLLPSETCVFLENNFK